MSIVEEEKREDTDSIIEVNEEDIPAPSDSSPEILEIPSSDSPEKEEVKRSSPSPPPPTTLSLAKVSEVREYEEDEDDEDLEDESLVERIVALSEMFPPGLVTATSNLCCFSVSAVKYMLSMSKVVSWAVFSSAGITFLPIIIESERSRIIEAEKQQQRQILLGPGAAVSGTV